MADEGGAEIAETLERSAVLRGAVERFVLFVGFEPDRAAEVGLHAWVDHREGAGLFERVHAVVGGGVRVFVALFEPTAAFAGGGGRGFGAEGAELLPASETGSDGKDDKQYSGESEAAVAGQFGECVAGDGEHGGWRR